MKRIFTLILCTSLSWNVRAQLFIQIQAIGPVDVCFTTVTLQVVSPQPGYSYTWNIGAYECQAPLCCPTPYGIATGSQVVTYTTGEFFCKGVGPSGIPEYSNPIVVRNLPGSAGSPFMPAPGFAGGNTTCVTSASLCIPTVYYQIDLFNSWPNTTIQWYKNDVIIPGATSVYYAATSTGYYKYSVQSSCTTAFSDSTLVTTIPVATVTASGATTFCQGNNVILNAETAPGYSYKWKKNGIDISGAVLSSYTATASGSYAVQITNSCGTATSTAVAVTVNSSPSATITAGGSVTFCSGGSALLNAPVVANRTYQWRKNGVNIPGAISSSYIATASGTYRVTVTNTVTGCTKVSGTAAVVTVLAKPAATVTPQGPTTFCSGGSVVLGANNGTGFSYKWKKNNVYVNLATAINYTATTAGTYRVEVTNSNGCSKLSAGVIVNVPCREGSIFQEENIQVHATVIPSPVTEDAILKFEEPIDLINAQLVISDILGKTVRNINPSVNGELIIEKKYLCPGIYFFRFINNSSTAATGKFIVE